MKRDRPRTPPSYQVPALDKGLDILELLAAAGKPLTLADMARALADEGDTGANVVLQEIRDCVLNARNPHVVLSSEHYWPFAEMVSVSEPSLSDVSRVFHSA